MSAYTIITFPSDYSNQDVKIAGNFTDWQQKSLTFNDSNNRFEYKVDKLIDGATNGKYSFKFIVDGDWQVNQDFSSEFDPSGNENNVIFYDYTLEKTASTDHVTKIKDQVSHENELEPHTPDPTPYSLSAQSTNAQGIPSPITANKTGETEDKSNSSKGTGSAITTATITAAASAAAAAGAASTSNSDSTPKPTPPITENPSSKETSNTSPVVEGKKTVASKKITENKTEPKESSKSVTDSTEFIPLTEPTKAEKPILSKRSSVPGPEPVKRPEAPTKTESPAESTSKKAVDDVAIGKQEPVLPKPVSRPEPPKPTGEIKTTPQSSGANNPATTAAVAKPLSKTTDPTLGGLGESSLSTKHSSESVSNSVSNAHTSKVTETVPKFQPPAFKNQKEVNPDFNGTQSTDTSNPSTTFYSNENTRPSTQLTQNTEAHPPSQGKELPEYSIGFFATILHVITQFFRRWFGE